MPDFLIMIPLKSKTMKVYSTFATARISYLPKSRPRMTMSICRWLKAALCTSSWYAQHLYDNPSRGFRDMDKTYWCIWPLTMYIWPLTLYLIWPWAWFWMDLPDNFTLNAVLIWSPISHIYQKNTSWGLTDMGRTQNSVHMTSNLKSVTLILIQIKCKAYSVHIYGLDMITKWNNGKASSQVYIVINEC